MIKEGDFVMGKTRVGLVHGKVEHVMTEGGTLGSAGSEYALTSMPPENPAMSVRIYEEKEKGTWKESAYSIGMMYTDATKLERLEGHHMNSEEEMEMGKSYHSDDEEMDKWDNIQKACWVGYEQRGMKEKGGRMVPNCVPIKKEENMEIDKAKKPNYDEFIKPRSGGSAPSNPKLYARVVQAAKDKFDVYPSAVANSWVVQEYKRRGGTYKSEKEITKGVWGGAFDPLTLEK